MLCPWQQPQMRDGYTHAGERARRVGRGSAPIPLRPGGGGGMSHPERVLVTWLPPDEDRWLRRVVPGAEVIRCQNQQMIIDLADRADVLILDPLLARSWLHDDGSRRVLGGTPVILRGALDEAFVRLVSECSRSLSHCFVSLRQFDDLASDLKHVLDHGGAADPALLLVDMVVPLVPTEAQLPLVGAAVLGRRRTRLPAFARCCSLSPRALEYRLERYSLPHAGKLLGWSLSLHALWRHEVLDWPLKRCATTAAFSESGSLSAYIGRHVQHRPHAMRESGGFGQLLARWGALFECRLECPPRPPVTAP